MPFKFEQHFDEASFTFTYFIIDENKKELAIVDSVKEHTQQYVEIIKQRGLTLKYLLETHVHADHITANAKLLEFFPSAKIAMHKECAVTLPFFPLSDGQIINVGDVSIQCLYTPGHTSDSVCFIVNNDRILTGDTVLIDSCGRTDFQAGNTKQMFESLQKVANLDYNILIYPAHDYKNRRVSCVGEQRLLNKLMAMSYLELKTEVDSWNLPEPKRLHEAVPANLRCGAEN